MIDVFFRLLTWLRVHGLDPDDYAITVEARNPRAYYVLLATMQNDATARTCFLLAPLYPDSFRAGKICGIKYRVTY